MYRCFVCKSTFVTIQQLLRHLKRTHAFYPGRKFLLVCDQNGCRHRFCTFSGFRKHLHSKHSVESLDQIDNEPVTPTPSVVLSDEQTMSVESAISEQPVNSQSFNETRQHTQEMCASLIAKLQSCGVATNVIKNVVENMEELVEELHSNVKDDIVKLLPNDEDIRTKFDDYFLSLENPFSNLNRDKMEKTFQREMGSCRTCGGRFKREV